MRNKEHDILIDHELERGMSEIKNEGLIAHLKSIIHHQSTLTDYIAFFKAIEPKPTNNLIFLDSDYKVVDLTDNTTKFLNYKQEDLKKIVGKTYTDLMLDPNQREIFNQGTIKRDAFRQILMLKGNDRYYHVRSRILNYLETKKDYLMGIVLRIKKA